MRLPLQIGFRLYIVFSEEITSQCFSYSHIVFIFRVSFNCVFVFIFRHFIYSRYIPNQFSDFYKAHQSTYVDIYHSSNIFMYIHCIQKCRRHFKRRRGVCRKVDLTPTMQFCNVICYVHVLYMFCHPMFMYVCVNGGVMSYTGFIYLTHNFIGQSFNLYHSLLIVCIE